MDRAVDDFTLDFCLVFEIRLIIQFVPYIGETHLYYTVFIIKVLGHGDILSNLYVQFIFLIVASIVKISIELPVRLTEVKYKLSVRGPSQFI